MKIPDILPEDEKPVGIWIRVSTEDQAQGDSPQNHEVRARHYADSRNGWVVREVHDLAGVSGKSVMEHSPGKVEKYLDDANTAIGDKTRQLETLEKCAW
jgi:DNA invertase Pin-like site-specific DNA recombinase